MYWVWWIITWYTFENVHDFELKLRQNQWIWYTFHEFGQEICVQPNFVDFVSCASDKASSSSSSRCGFWGSRPNFFWKQIHIVDYFRNPNWPQYGIVFREIPTDHNMELFSKTIPYCGLLTKSSILKISKNFDFRYLISHERRRPRHVFKKCLDQLFWASGSI